MAAGMRRISTGRGASPSLGLSPSSTNANVVVPRHPWRKVLDQARSVNFNTNPAILSPLKRWPDANAITTIVNTSPESPAIRSVNIWATLSKHELIIRHHDANNKHEGHEQSLELPHSRQGEPSPPFHAQPSNKKHQQLPAMMNVVTWKMDPLPLVGFQTAYVMKYLV
ncbi:hypothetical protein DICA1_E07316 [Diutina catenulata]